MWQTLAAFALFAFSAAVIDRLISVIFDCIAGRQPESGRKPVRPARCCRVAVENPVYAQQAKRLAEKLYPGCRYQYFTGSLDEIVCAFNAQRAEIAVILDREGIPLDSACEAERVPAYGRLMEIDGIEMSPLDCHMRRLVVYSALNHGKQ